MNEQWLFPKNPKEAIQIQREMAEHVVQKDALLQTPSLICGIDVSNPLFNPSKVIYGAAVLLSYPSLQVLETTTSASQQRFPYIPGLLGFREAPVLVEAFQKLKRQPDLLFVDGQGLSHPRGFGIASHLGVLLDIPAIGVAKSILVGSLEGTLAEKVGSQVPLLWKGKKIGLAVRTKKNCSPLIVSIGHKISLKTAVEWVFRCLKGYRHPEPIRQAHLAANTFRRSG